MRTRAQAADPAALDLSYLSTSFDVPADTLQQLIDAPSIELVRELLATVTNKAQDYDALQADKLKVDVELENTVRTSETKVKAQKTAAAKNVKEIEELRTKLNEVENARESLSSELDHLRSSTTDSSAETQTLRQRIETLEATNRDALALVERKSVEKDGVAKELSEQHEKFLGLRREISQLEERNQTLDNAASSQKFREQSLQQELDLLKRNNEWHSSELQTRTQEHAKFRKERNARIGELQRELEDSLASAETLKRSEATLRQRLDDLQGKADEAFEKIASLEESFSRKEQGWKAELDGSKRLAELQAQNAATHKARLQEVQAQVDQIKDDAAEEIGRLQAEIETERSYKDEAESKLAQLELKVESLEQQQARPGELMRNGASNPATPARAGSPFALTGSTRKYANGMPFSTTQAQAKWYEMEEELAAERRRTAKLSTAMDEMIQEIENRGPELVELRGEQERLEQEVVEFSQMLDDANSTRDEAVKEVERLQADCHAKNHEGDILRQQLRDLSTQVKILLVELQSRDQGLGEMSAQERLELERAARGELEDWSTNETFTNQFIAQRLVIFRNVDELEAQNAEQLRLLHELGEKLEGDEAREKAHKSEAFATENEQLREQLARYKDELKSTNTTIESYAKERDMFRRMLQHRGQISSDADVQALFGQSVPPATPQRASIQGVPPTPRSKEVEELNTLLKQQQSFFDQFRNEASTDRKSLQEQVDGLSRDRGNLQSEIAHWKSQKTLSDERQAMLQSNFTALRNENNELQKRSQQMGENAARQDLRTQQVAEELVEAKSIAESLRNENANAKAEKDLWKRIESRLTDDNKSLMDERSRLNKLVTDLQNLQNERELSDSETRKRLQSRIESLESELAETKKKLDAELEDSRKITLRREYEEGQSRTRIDDLVKSLGNVREELVAAKTSRDQLQSRVDEMKIELQSAQERAAALQPRPTPRPQPAQNGDQQESVEELSAEQRLSLEVSDLRRDLEFARNELESTKEQVESYKAIAQSTEEELANFNETSEQYKEENDRLLAEKNARVQELEQKVEDLASELTTSNGELSELRTKSEDSNRILNEQRTNFEADISRLKDDAERHAEEKKLYQEDLKAQAEIAQQAQQSYENELVKHADAAKGLQSVRNDYNELRTEVAGIRAEAEAAKASLERGEESWTEQKEAFEKELEEAKRRHQDVNQQNELLHRQMEGFSSELAALRSGRAIPDQQGDETTAAPATDSGNLQEVIKYLRREKEIVDVQYELSMQESRRLQQQLDYTNTQLEETRQKLVEERRQANEKSASEGSTTKLMETINELNLYRESATTLRNEARQSRERLEAKTSEVERLLAELEPLKGRVSELEDELESKEGDRKLLQDDRDHWRERTQNIISKYDRVDPAELEELKKKLEDLGAEKEQLLADQAPMKEQLEKADTARQEAVDETTQNFNARIEKLKSQAIDQNRRQVARIREVEAAVEAVKTEKTEVEQSLEGVKAELEQTKQSLQQAQASSEQATEQQQSSSAPQAEDQTELQAKVASAEANATEQSSRADALNSEVQRLQARVVELESQTETLQQQLRNALDNAEEGEVSEAAPASNDTLDKLKEELEAAQKEVESLRENASQSHAADDTRALAQPADGEKSVAEQVAEEVAKLRSELEAQHQVSIQQMEKTATDRIEKMKAQLRDKLKEEREQNSQSRQKLIEEHSAELQKLRDEHETAIAQLKSDHQVELERLSKEGGEAVEKAQAADGSAPQAEGTSAPSAEVTGEQMIGMIKNDARVRGLFTNNLTKRITAETEKLNATIAEKEQEITNLTQALEAARASATGSGTNANELAELQKRLETADQEKQTAVRQATEIAEKKAKVQLSQRDLMAAKISVVRKAVSETPDKPVKEVWEAADKARPAAKPAAPTTIASPASTAKPAVPPSPTQAQPNAQAPALATGTPEDQAKIQQRQERFGTVSQTTDAPTGTFGQPSNPPAAGFGTFGQPSQQGQPASASQQSSPNPQAPAFTPAARPNAPFGIPAKPPTGIPSGIPRGGATGIPRGGARGGAQGMSIQGAAQQGTFNAAKRGGAASDIGRGGSNIGRGGRGGAFQRGGGAANTGQKRQHEGQHQGDEKRMRGGAQGGGA